MKPARNTLLVTALIAALTVSGCSSLPSFGRQSAADRAAEDRVGRLAMVLDDEKIEPNPGFAGVMINLPPARQKASWTEAGGSPTKAAGHVEAAPDLAIAWRRSAGRGSSNRSALTTPPVTNETLIFTLDSTQSVRAMRLDTGSTVWTKRLQGLTRRDRSAVGGGLAVAGDKLVVASGFGFVTALNVESGEEIWRRPMGVPMIGSPTVDDNRVFVSSNNNEIFALDLRTGQTLWSDQAIAESARVLGSPSAAAIEDFIISPFSSGEIIAFLAANGRRLWVDAIQGAGRFTPISEINDIGSRPVLGAGLVFASNQSGATVAIDGRSGARVWGQPVGSTRAPALAGRYLFVIGTEGELVCLDVESGEAYWVTQLPRYRDEEKRRNRITYSAPIVASNRIILASSRGELLAFSPQTGEQTGSLRLGDTVYIEPIAAQGRLYVLTDRANLIAIR